MNKNMLLTVLIGVLIIVSALQTVQLMGITGVLSGGGASVSSVSSSVQKSASSNLPSNLQDLPSMVGGC